jgi:hypothetical protein
MAASASVGRDRTEGFESCAKPSLGPRQHQSRPGRFLLKDRLTQLTPTARRAGCDLGLPAGIPFGLKSPRRGGDVGCLDGKAVLTHHKRRKQSPYIAEMLNEHQGTKHQ